MATATARALRTPLAPMQAEGLGLSLGTGLVVWGVLGVEVQDPVGVVVEVVVRIWWWGVMARLLLRLPVVVLVVVDPVDPPSPTRIPHPTSPPRLPP